MGRDITVEGVRFRIVGVQAPGQIFSDENYYDANGILIPIETYMDRIDPDHKLSALAVKLASKRDLNEVSATMIGRAKQAHHNIEAAVSFEDLSCNGPAHGNRDRFL